ncbi:NAD+ synthase [Amorphus sp. 3PC139-8]|uniref:NAD+ synthase n=1 Tax=Amorphus sp. 3PC139-8 TaxID=2735676 RepID=UPI00345D908B
MVETASIRIAIAQLDPIVGDVAGNLDLALGTWREAREKSADILVFPELFISGAPPEGLAADIAFCEACRSAIETLADVTGDGNGPAVLIGTPWREAGRLFNAVAVLDRGEVQALTYKAMLSVVGSFDERRLFVPGPTPGPIAVRGVRLGIAIGDDLRDEDVVECLAETGADILVAPMASPFIPSAPDQRLQAAVARVVAFELPVVVANLVGGQDEVVFDGASFGLNADRSLGFQLPQFGESVVVTHWDRDGESWTVIDGPRARLPDATEATWRACLCGLKAYMEKNGFRGVTLDLTGGLDSAVCAAMAVDALGAERVHALSLFGQNAAPESLEDAAEVAKVLGIALETVPIEPGADGVLTALAAHSSPSLDANIDEMIAARVRGTLLMARAQATHTLPLAAIGKSDLATGFAASCGDMSGSFDPIKDLYRTDLVRLARWRNGKRPLDALGPERNVVPQRVLSKPPHAGLSADRSRQAAIPPQAILDGILQALLEDGLSVSQVTARGYVLQTVRAVADLIYRAEPKRRQAAPGVMLTSHGIAQERRFPITNRFRDRR